MCSEAEDEGLGGESFEDMARRVINDEGEEESGDAADVDVDVVVVGREAECLFCCCL